MSLGHILLSGIFIINGAEAFSQPGGRVNMVEKAGIPAPRPSVILNAATMVVGGTALALDIAPKVAALALLASLIPTTLVGHAFWNEKDANARKNQRTQFLKNLGLIGGLVLVLFEKKK